MCRRRLTPKPCMNYKCPHNLFWEGLRLNPEKFRITNRALEVRNCCCLINEPWTIQEIGDAWGLPKEKIMRCEAMAWKKIYTKNVGHNQTERLFHQWIDKQIHKTIATDYPRRNF